MLGLRVRVSGSVSVKVSATFSVMGLVFVADVVSSREMVVFCLEYYRVVQKKRGHSTFSQISKKNTEDK